MLRRIFLMVIAVGAVAIAADKDDAMRGLLRVYDAESGDIDKLLEMHRAVNDALFTEAMRALEEDGNLPVWGDGEISVVEFSDYQCGYCRRMLPLLEDSVNDDKTRVQIVEFPVLGELSEKAARYALAADMQGKYIAFHRRLMTLPGRLDEDELEAAAQSLNLDLARLRQDAKSARVDEMLERNYKLARLLDVSATPTFIVGGDVLVRGAVHEEDFQRLLRDIAARQ